MSIESQAPSSQSRPYSDIDGETDALTAKLFFFFLLYLLFFFRPANSLLGERALPTGARDASGAGVYAPRHCSRYTAPARTNSSPRHGQPGQSAGRHASLLAPPPLHGRRQSERSSFETGRTWTRYARTGRLVRAAFD